MVIDYHVHCEWTVWLERAWRYGCKHKWCHTAGYADGWQSDVRTDKGVPKHLQQHCPDSFLNCAVVSKHEDDEQLRLQFPNTYDATFIIPPCHRRSDFHSRNSIVNKLHDSVPVHIFVAMMEGGIIDLLEGQPVDTWKQRWCEDSS